MLFKTWPFASQKVAFCRVKYDLLQGEMWPFEKQLILS